MECVTALPCTSQAALRGRLFSLSNARFCFVVLFFRWSVFPRWQLHTSGVPKGRWPRCCRGDRRHESCVWDDRRGPVGGCRNSGGSSRSGRSGGIASEGGKSGLGGYLGEENWSRFCCPWLVVPVGVSIGARVAVLFVYGCVPIFSPHSCLLDESLSVFEHSGIRKIDLVQMKSRRVRVGDRVA